MSKFNKILTKEILIKEYLNIPQTSAVYIAKKFNCSAESVRIYLRKYNMPIRSTKECLLGKVLHPKNCKCLFCQGKRGELTKNNIRQQHQGRKKRAINGYTLIKDYTHPDRNSHGDILEHRLVMEKKIGRRLKKSEIVHHIDQNRTNNKQKNLYLCSGMSSHGTVHASFRKLLPLLLEKKIIIFKQGKYMINSKGVFGGHRKGVN
jgi:HNH endonuclease